MRRAWYRVVALENGARGALVIHGHMQGCHKCIRTAQMREKSGVECDATQGWKVSQGFRDLGKSRGYSWGEQMKWHGITGLGGFLGSEPGGGCCCG